MQEQLVHNAHAAEYFVAFTKYLYYIIVFILLKTIPSYRWLF